jgi:hypothetical protein
MPVSMVLAPSDVSRTVPTDGKRFAGELDEDFEAALARIEFAPSRGSFARRIMSPILRLVAPAAMREQFHNVDRHVAFDGFRGTLHDEKRERDRRYGTVYSMTEARNAYLVRLELPRSVPASALKQTWGVPDEMPDYDYTLSLNGGVLSIRAGLPGETYRRLSYVSSSFPSQFLTRIEFDQPVGGFRHRLRDKMLEVIVFKLPTVRQLEA